MEISGATSENFPPIIKSESGVVMDSCRVCMAHDTSLAHMFDSHGSGIIDRILFCTGVQFVKEEDLPTKICVPCLQNLDVAHKFKTMCLRADESFRNALLIKTEVTQEQQGTNTLKKEEDTNMYEDSWSYDTEADIKDDFLEKVLRQNGRKSRGRIKEQHSDSSDVVEITSKGTKKRGPYKKSGKPRKVRVKVKKQAKFTIKGHECKTCDVKFATKKELDKHRIDVHKEEDTWICEICGKVFAHRGSHYTHIRSHLPPGFACEHCDYKTWHKSDLVKHVRIHTGTKLYQCEFCTASYYNSSNLSEHIRRRHVGTRRFPCHLCDKRFFDRTKLNRHLDSHNDVKRFECEVCHSCFTRRCYWKKHLQLKHGVVLPAQRPGRQKTNMLVGEPEVSIVARLLAERVATEGFM